MLKGNRLSETGMNYINRGWNKYKRMVQAETHPLWEVLYRLGEEISISLITTVQKKQRRVLERFSTPPPFLGITAYGPHP